MRSTLACCLMLAVAACERSPSSPPTQAPAAPTGLPLTQAQKAQHWWTCGEVEVRTERQGEMLLLSGPFGERTLPAQSSASGARYADDRGNEFWNQGDAVRLKIDGEDVGECQEDKAS